MPLIPGDQLLTNLATAWNRGDLGTQLLNSFIMAGRASPSGRSSSHCSEPFPLSILIIGSGWWPSATVFCTLMLPVEVRILPTYEMAANLFGPLQPLWDALGLNGLVSWFAGHDISVKLEFSLLDSYAGLILIVDSIRHLVPFCSDSFF